MTNRLNLDFSLYSSEERQEYVTAYLNSDLEGIKDNYYVSTYNNNKYPFPFPGIPTSKELETIADYVLYGKTKPSAGFNVKGDGSMSIVDAGYVQIDVRDSPWNKKRPDSLDTLIDDAQETGNPVEIQYNLTGGIRGKKEIGPPLRIVRETFSRKETRNILQARNDKALLQEYENLWKNIDKIDYAISTYSLNTGRRKLPIRDELEARMTQEEKNTAVALADSLNMFTWGKLRKLLVELRQQQYILRDGFSPTVGRPRQRFYAPCPSLIRGFRRILPAGSLNKKNNFSKTIFLSTIESIHFSQLFQTKLLNFLLEYDKYILEGPGVGDFDFRNPENIALLIYAQADLEPNEDMDIERQEELCMLLDTLQYYIARAHIEPMHHEIINMKAEGYTNDTIARYINKKYKKTYSPNYISTIFRSKCCGGIAEAAKHHWKILDKLAVSKEEFKRCSTCNLLLLRDTDNYVRKARAKDGFASRCKICDKRIREDKVRKNNNKDELNNEQ